MERIRLGRESLERRRRRQQQQQQQQEEGEYNAPESWSRSLSSSALDHLRRGLGRPDVDGDVDMDTPLSVPAKKAVVTNKNGNSRSRKKGVNDDDAEYVPSPRDDDDDDGDGDNDDDGDNMQPRRTERKFTKAAIQRENELEKRRRQQQQQQTDQEELRSRFIEGSMRDRASAPPPRDIVGDAHGGGGDGCDNDDDAYYAGYLPTSTTTSSTTQDGADKDKSQKKKKHGFIFGLGNLFRFSPFALVDEARAAYIRQKALHEKKEERKRQKREAEQLYLEMKARGEFRATFVDGNGAGGSARKRKLGEISSLGSDASQSLHPSLDHYDPTGAAADYMEEDTEVDEPEPGPEPEEAEAEAEAEGEEGEDSEEGERGGEYSDSEVVVVADEMVRSVRYEDTTIPPYRATPPKRFEEKPKGMRRLVKRTSEVFTNALTPASPTTSPMSTSTTTTTTATTTTTTTTSAPTAKPLTKREIQKQERLLKKVSNLEEQLEKARRELEAVARGTAAPPVPALPSDVPPPPPPPPPPHPTPVSRPAQDARANGMPPPPVPTTSATAKMKGALVGEPETPVPKKRPAVPSVVINKMLPDTPDKGGGNRFAPGVMSPAADGDDDTAMDEDFSIIPLSPVLNSSSIAADNKQQQEQQEQQQQQQPGALATSRVRRNGARTRSKSPGGGLAGLRKISGASVRRVSSALSGAVNGSPAAGAGDGKPEKKKLKKSNLWGLPGPGEGGEQVPPIPKLPPSGT